MSWVWVREGFTEFTGCLEQADSECPGPGPAPLHCPTVIRSQDQGMFFRTQLVPGFLTVNTSSVLITITDSVCVITRNLIIGEIWAWGLWPLTGSLLPGLSSGSPPVQWHWHVKTFVKSVRTICKHGEVIVTVTNSATTLSEVINLIYRVSQKKRMILFFGNNSTLERARNKSTVVF